MSRAVAPAERRTGDAYHTPEPLARALVGLLPIHSKICWEPHAGGGGLRGLRVVCIQAGALRTGGSRAGLELEMTGPLRPVGG